MNVKRLYFVLIGLVGLLFIGLLAGTYGINNLLTQHANQLTKLKAKDLALDHQQVRLVKAKQQIKANADLEKIAKVVVPEDKDQAEAVRELTNIANANGITIGSITFPVSTLGQSTGGSSSATTNTGSSATVTPKLPSLDSPTNKLSQLVAVPGIPGVYQLTINMVTDPQAPAQYSQIISFLKGLERNRRTAQVTTINIQPQPLVVGKPQLFNVSLTINEYIKP